jgi:ABC-type multidrug transport system fused ATPase/permease subunit
MNNIVNTVYEIFNRKVFSLPKILLLPTVMSKQPLLVAKVFPLIIGSDWLKASVVAYMTTKIEQLQKETQELQGIRSKVEAFDIKNAELLQRSGQGATQFTMKRWEEMTVNIQRRLILQELISRSKDFFAFMQRNFVFVVLIDCALADLIALGRITAADTFVYSRAYEDAIDFLLMRSRGEAELARMMTEITKLEELSSIWNASRSRNLLSCRLAPPSESKNLVIRNLQYSRGTALARADHLELRPGIYALTGSNGSGKSTLFRLLMSCDTNEKSVDLPASINLLTPTRVLTEADDIMRETSCETENELEIVETTTASVVESRDVTVGLDGELAYTNVTAPIPKLPFKELHPRLSITMPSPSVVEISQSFYWPLYR